MDFIQIYMIILGGCVVLLLLLRIVSIPQGRMSGSVQKHLLYPYFYRRFRLLPPATRYGVLLQITYWSVSLTCNFVRIGSIAEIGTRAANLSVLNLIPLLFASRLSFVADFLGISLQRCQQLHSSMGLMASLQALTHILIYTHLHHFSFDESVHFYGLLV
jgi:hypothetical protein